MSVPRTNTPGVYQNLTTRYEGGGAGSAGCPSCAYDVQGNALAETDPIGFTKTYQRNERGELYGATGPAPYNFQVQFYFDANRNTIRLDTQDWQVIFDSIDPSDAGFGQFTPSGNGSTTANLPMQPGPGGALRPGWFTNLFTYDLLDDKISADMDATNSNPASLLTSYTYDPNQNLIKVTKPNGNTIEYDYDERDLRIAQRVGYVAGGFAGAVTLWGFDDNGNMVDEIGPEVRGQPGNSQTASIADAFMSGTTLVHTGDYVLANNLDGFDRTLSTTDAVGGTLENTFDPEDNTIATAQFGTAGGATPTDRTGSQNVPLVSGETRYDEASQAYEQQANVFLNTGLSGGAPTNNLPSGRAATHTGGGLAANSTTNTNTGTVTLTTGGQSYILTRTAFDRAGRTTASANDNGAVATTQYDGADRAILETDALGNQTMTTYDGNGNAVVIQVTEVGTITEPPQGREIFTTFNKFDCMNQLVFSAGNGPDGSIATQEGVNLALITKAGFDSRGNQTASIDAKGNTVVNTFDGASRGLQVFQNMRQNGEGANPPAGTNGTAGTFTATGQGQNTGSILTTFEWDGNGNKISMTDDRGGITLWDFDTMDRDILMTMHDGSKYSKQYNLASDIINYTVANGSIFANTFDPRGGNTAVAITPASGVGGSTAQAFQYDGEGRKTLSSDTSPAGTVTNTFNPDSLSRNVEEQQQNVDGSVGYDTNTAFVSTPATQEMYPNNRAVNISFDVLYRKQRVIENATGAVIAAWQYFGPGRVAEVALGNGLIQTMLNNARTHSAVQGTVPNPAWGTPSSDRLGYDGAGRFIAKRYLTGGINSTTFAYNNTNPVVGNTAGYDPASNKNFERALHAENTSNLYQPFDLADGPDGGYDSINRLLQYQRGVLSDAGGYLGDGGGSIITPIGITNTNVSRNWNLDGLGNWRQVQTMPANSCSGVTDIRSHNKLNEITQRNTYELPVPFLYDGTPGASNGNLINDGTLIYGFDALNRLLTVKRASDGLVIATYVYDAQNRRVRKIVTNGGLTGNIPDSTTDYFYSGWQVMEERNASGNTPLRQYVWGNYIDECIQLTTFAALGAQNLPAGTYYLLQDLLYRAVALTNSTGGIVEAYDTDAYGNTIIFTAPDPSGNWFSYGATQSAFGANEIIFCGYRFDPETILYHVRNRTYSPGLGRWIQRDPIWYVDGGNLYQYVRGRAEAAADPSGLGCRVNFHCTLVRERLGGCTRYCHYLCREVPGSRRVDIIGSSGWWGCLNMPRKPVAYIDAVEHTSYWCIATAGCGGSPSKCKPTRRNQRIYDVINFGDCSRAACVGGCRNAKELAKQSCELIINDAAKKLCKRLAAAAYPTCVDSCYAFCKKP